MNLAQLIKLQDYISRYEQDLTKYSNQYVRLKKQRWQEKKSEFNGKQMQALREEFLQDLFINQLRWASSTIFEMSELNKIYETDDLLKRLLQYLPDTYFLMYYPVFQIEQAPIELEAVLITPLQIYCLAFLKGEKDDIFQASRERFWTVWRGDEQVKVVSPLLSLKRSKNVVARITNNLLPIKQLIFAHEGYVDFFQEWAYIECIDKRNVKQWFRDQVKNPSPLKSLQIKAANLLLNHTRTEYYERSVESTISWEIDQIH